VHTPTFPSHLWAQPVFGPYRAMASSVKIFSLGLAFHFDMGSFDGHDWHHYFLDFPLCMDHLILVEL
jgi:hypothetical protein